MKIISEQTEKKQHVLIVEGKSTPLTNALGAELKKFSSEVYTTSQIPLAFEKFDYVFLINQKNLINKINFKQKQKVIFIFINQKQKAQDALKTAERGRLSVKIISYQSSQIDKQDLEKILWFSFSKSNEIFLNIVSLRGPAKKERLTSGLFSRIITPKTLIITGLLILISVHLMMIPSLALSSYLYYKSGMSLKQKNIRQAEQFLTFADTSFNLSKYLYQPVRPSYSFFSLALYPDSVFDIDEKTKSVLHTSLTVYESTSQIFQAVLKKNKTKEEKSLLEMRLNKMSRDLDRLDEDLTTLIRKLPDSPKQLSLLKPQLTNSLALLEKGKKIFPHLETLLAKGGQKKYLLLFANNMELRPGGGFIGSFGILTMKDLTLESIKIYDVYDADGQLTAHIDPPDAIRRYLHQPHWFLRDSAFSSDFYENYNEAKFFLNQELRLTDFLGGILLTTTSIQNILEAFGNIYLPDFGENVNKDNFYIKAQLYSEKNFFPGSIQKKNFLGNLAKEILINLDTVSAPVLLQQIEKSLDEKQMVMVVDDQSVQNVIDSLYWAGKTITPRCPGAEPKCIIDYTFPVDANLGVNKANFFIRRNITQKIKIDAGGAVTDSFVIKIQNDSANDIFPGGAYKNYFQLYLPVDSQIKRITRDGTQVENVDERQGEFKVIGFYFELPPQKSVEIQVDYQLPQKLSYGSNTYQLIWQKQTGSQNSDLALEITLPENISPLRQNFSPLVKDNRIFYNTSLDTDKIFLIELFKR